MVRRSMTRSLPQCNPSSKTRLQSMSLISGRVLTLKLKIKKVAGYWNYDGSEFDSVSALSADDDELEATWKQEYSLEAFTNKDQFKTYEELEKRLNLVLGITQRNAVPTVDSEEYEPAVFDTPSGGGFNDADITPQSSFRQQMSAPLLSRKRQSLKTTMPCPTSLNWRRSDGRSSTCLELHVLRRGSSSPYGSSECITSNFVWTSLLSESS